MTYRLGQQLTLATMPTIVSVGLRMLASTWRATEEGETALSSRRKQPEARIYVGWHECIMAMICGYRDQPVHPLASRSYDGELISRLAGCLGYPPPARGSSSRGGGQGMMEMKTLLDAGRHIYITVDGPRGPRQQSKDGPLKLAQLSGRAIVPIAFAAKWFMRLNSWDRTIVPAPFSRGVFQFGAELRVPRECLDMAPYTKTLNNSLAQCHAEADASLAWQVRTAGWKHAT